MDEQVLHQGDKRGLAILLAGAPVVAARLLDAIVTALSVRGSELITVVPTQPVYGGLITGELFYPDIGVDKYLIAALTLLLVLTVSFVCGRFLSSLRDYFSFATAFWVFIASPMILESIAMLVASGSESGFGGFYLSSAISVGVLATLLSFLVFLAARGVNKPTYGKA